MDRRRYLEWAEHQLAFFARAGARVSSEGHRRSAALDGEQALVFEAHPDGSLSVGLESADEDRRARWAEVFRRTRGGQPPWPPGPPPDEVGKIELVTDPRGHLASLHFRWSFLGQDLRLALPAVVSCLSWLLLLEPSQDSPAAEIELPDEPGEPLEIEWD